MARTVDRQGLVSAFDEHVGLGELVDDADQRTYPFHCTAMIDSSRTVDVGQRVLFRVVGGGGGRWEAGAIRKPAGNH